MNRPIRDATRDVTTPRSTGTTAGTTAGTRAASTVRPAPWARVRGRARGCVWLFIAFVGGLALDAAFAPLGWWPIAVPATAAVMLAVRGQRARVGRLGGWRGGLLVGFVAGLGEFLPLLAWLRVVTPLAWLVLAPAEAVFLALLGGALSLVIGRLPGWPVWAACLWVSEEFARDRWPLGGFTWGRLAFSQPDTPFTGYAALGGAPLVTFAVALSAALLLLAADAAPRAWAPRRRARLVGRPGRFFGGRQAAVVVAAGVLGALAVPSLGLCVPRPTEGHALQVAVVQGNVAHPGKHFLGRAQQVLDNHLRETGKLAAAIAAGRLAQPKIVIWPENSTDTDPLTNPKLRAEIQAATEKVKAPILVGAVLNDGPDNVTNTGIAWSPTTGPGQEYTKRHLVPFGEYMPWRGLVSHLTSLTSLVPKNFVPGHGTGALDIGPTRIADVMCFEVAFDGDVRSGVTHGGRLIVVQTNNATYMGTAEPSQQLAMEQLRAVEHGRSVVVGSTSGISAVIAPNGHIVARTKEMTPAIIDLPVVERTHLTLADHLGVLPEWVIGILGVLAVVVAATGLASTSRPRTFRQRAVKENVR